MSAVDNTEASQADAIAMDFDLSHAPTKVWRALTDPALLSQWLLPVMELKLEAGAAFMFKAPPQGGWDGTVNCQVREIEAHRKLSYTWVVGDARGIDTVVTFTLTPTETGTRLSLAHTGFKLPAQKGALAGTRYGWNLMSAKLVELLGRLA